MSWRLFDQSTPVIIQGITGKEGSRMARWLLASGVRVVGGVTPGKGGQQVDGLPVFNSVIEARQLFPEIETSCIVVPSSRVIGAFQEVIDAGVRYVYILTEQVPVHDVMIIRRLAAERGISVLGPSSVGYVQFPRFRLGYLGGENPFSKLKEGGVAVISTSGGMTNEIMMGLARANIGIRLAVALGGDRIVGTTLEEAVTWVQGLDNVTSIVLFVEPGSTLLRSLADGLLVLKKPAVIFLAGEILDDLPRDMPYGHTGTILGEDEPSMKTIHQELCDRGIACVGTMSQLIEACRAMKRKQDEYRLYGRSISQLIREHDLVSDIWLAWTGKQATEAQRVMLEACLVACIDHGAEPPSAHVARRVASCGKPLADCVAAGLLTLGPRHGNAGSAASRWIKEKLFSKLSVAEIVDDILINKERIPGFGHPEYDNDPRTAAMYDVVVTQNVSSVHFELALAISRQLTERKGKPLPLNVDGALGAIVADLDLPVEIADAIFITARTIGLIMHSRDEAAGSTVYRRG